MEGMEAGREEPLAERGGEEPLAGREEPRVPEAVEADGGGALRAAREATSPLEGPIPRPAWADEPRYREASGGGPTQGRPSGAAWVRRPAAPETAPWAGRGRPWVRVYRGTGHPEYVPQAPVLTPRAKAVFLGRHPAALVRNAPQGWAPPAAVRAAAARLQAYARLTGEEGTGGTPAAALPPALYERMPAWGRLDALGRWGPAAPSGPPPTDADPWTAGAWGFGGLGAGAAEAAAGADAERAPTVGNPAAWAALERERVPYGAYDGAPVGGPVGSPVGGAGFTPASIRALKASHGAWAGRAVAVWVGVTLARPTPLVVSPAAVYRTLAEQNVTWAHPHGPAWWRRWMARRGRGALAPFLRRRRGRYGWTHVNTTTRKARGPLRLANDDAYLLRERARVIRGLDTLYWPKPALPRGSYVGLAGVEIVHARKEAWKAARRAEREAWYAARSAEGSAPEAPAAAPAPGAAWPRGAAPAPGAGRGVPGPRGPSAAADRGSERAPAGPRGPRGPRGPVRPAPGAPGASGAPGAPGAPGGGSGGGSGAFPVPGAPEGPGVWQPPVAGLDPGALDKRTERFVKVRRRGRIVWILVRGRSGGGRGRR